MTAILFVTLTIVGVPAAVGGALLYKSWRDAHDCEIPDYPPGVSYELADRPLRQAWDSLTDDERADLLREPSDKLLEDLSLLAWMAGLAMPVSNDVPALEVVPAARGDWGPSYG